jgi:hypothetical protein
MSSGSVFCGAEPVPESLLPADRELVWVGLMAGRWCWLDAQGTLECGADFYSASDDSFILPGKYVSASTNQMQRPDSVCGIRDDGHVVCFSEVTIPPQFPPDE